MTTPRAPQPPLLEVWPLGAPTANVMPHPSGREGRMCMARVALLGDWHNASRSRGAHGAQDIFAPRGTPILAPISGRVTTSTDGALGGWQVAIQGPRARVLLSHMAERPLVQVGDTVEAGQQVGLVGNTGSTALRSCPHLHIALYAMPGRRLVNAYNDLVRLMPEGEVLRPEPEDIARNNPPRPPTRPAARRSSGGGGWAWLLLGVTGAGILGALATRGRR